MRKILFLAIIILISGNLLGAGNSGDPKIQPVRTDTPPIIDGKLDDAAWSQSIEVSEFKTFRPDYGKDLGKKTIGYMAYDAENIYFAFKCYDDPNLIKTSIAARDKIEEDDWVCVNLDSYNDNQTLNGFYVNPNGIQRDTRYTGFRDDPGVDFVWYSAGKIDDEGYTVEIQIPFKSIRYSKHGDVVKMGVVFERYISRFSSNATYPEMDPDLGGNFLIQTMELEFTGIKNNMVVEVLPSVTYSWGETHEGGETVVRPGKFDPGITAKVGITSDLVFDLTVNPDFSQVESDVSQIDDNQRFPVFYPERRPFFQEGSENFSFAGSGRREGVVSIVNTRSIVNPLVAAKVTGKIGKSNRISALYAKDELIQEGGYTDPYAEVGVLRYRRSFSSDNYVGVFGTTRWANNAYNNVYGVDGQYRLNKQSKVYANFMQANDLDTVGMEPTFDNVWTAGYDFSSRRLSFNATVNNYAENFRSDVGYITRMGVTRFNLFARPSVYFEHPVFQRLDSWISLTQMLDHPTDLWENSYFMNLRLNMVRNSNVSFSANSKREIFEAQRYNVNNYRFQAEGQVNKRLNLNFEYSWANKIRYVENSYSGYGKDVSLEVKWQVNDNFNTELRNTFSDFYRDSDQGLDYDRLIIRSRNTYQVNKYLFIRAIVEYDSRFPKITSDFLASFTLIPGTVMHIGYGFLKNRYEWNGTDAIYESTLDQYETFSRGLFFKASYLWRKK